MLKKILIALAVLVLGLVLFTASRPADFHIERSAEIAAPAEVAFAFVNDFHYWGRWSPWEKLDPEMKKEFSGAPAGTGAVYYWLGNDKTGEGRMTIEQSVQSQKIAIRLEFLKPWQATNQATFTFEPRGEKTFVVWAMDGHNNFMAKLASLVMDMDALVGKDFAAGLANLNTVAAAEAQRWEAEKQAAAAKIKAAIDAMQAEAAADPGLGGDVVPVKADADE